MRAPLTPLQAYAERIAARARMEAAMARAVTAGDEERAAILAEQRDEVAADADRARAEAWQAAGHMGRSETP